MKITKKEVEHVAHLARLNLSEQELEKMTEQLDNLLSYVAKLDELDTENIRPTTHAFSISNAFREDRVQNSLSRKEALANSPKQNDEYFIVPRIL
ncbi:MAG: Asp-tRNA(Asn)/Glu-tRNA(Gln) amidotransferase subunit GatC [Desulfocapsaceae bacterium]|nr:Asp-tRNA(Asn)/Glu-tRNA(Gln) amidotransferase subunit GatC [Desulfocapsaceae bacterium]